MSQEFIEHYQNEYEKNPNSRMFAPLAEAYRRLGRLEIAEQICERGVQIHAHFASGRVAYARILIDLDRFEEAADQLKKATELSPDNLLAFSLLAETCLRLKRTKDALAAYKMLLFLNPNDEKAQKAVKKWEFLSAEEFQAESFAGDFGKGETPAPAKTDSETAVREQTGSVTINAARGPSKTQIAKTVVQSARELDRVLSLADVLTVRNDLERARTILTEADARLGHPPEIKKRLDMLDERIKVFQEPQMTQIVSEKYEPLMQKKQKLEDLLRRVTERQTPPA